MTIGRPGPENISLRYFRRLAQKARPARPSHAVAAAPTEEYIAYVDALGAGTINGWAASWRDKGLAVTVRVYLDDVLCAQGEASAYRSDVQAAGWGDGHHGFGFQLPKMGMLCASELRVAILNEQGGEIVCVTQKLRERATNRPPRLYFDASDLVEYLTHHRELSGIQRVQAGYLSGLGDQTIGHAQCRICARFKTSSFYFEFPYNLFMTLLREAGDADAVPNSAWSEHVTKLKADLAERAVFEQGDTILTLGAPWALDDHNETIRSAKLHDRAKYLQVFYDLIPISMPEVVAEPLIPHFARAMAAMTISADHVFAISRHAQDDLKATLTKLGRATPQSDVITMGGDIYDAPARGRISAPSSRCRGKDEIDRPFVLCVGTLEPRKNHALLLNVWRRLAEKYGSAKLPKLVLVGRVGWYMDDFMRQLRVSGYVDGLIVHLQGISNEALSKLYDTCMFTVFPSYSEGWGLPITESLARGKVCVCSNVTSMPEAGGDHAIYIDPFDTTDAFGVIEKLIFDEVHLSAKQASLRAFKAPTWRDASVDLGRQLERVLSRLRAEGQQTVRELSTGRQYRYHQRFRGSANRSAMRVFQDYLDIEEAASLLSGWNWYAPELDCTWSCGPEAGLTFSLPGNAAGYEAFFSLRVPPSYDGTMLEVRVCGERLAKFVVYEGAMSILLPLQGGQGTHEILLCLMGEPTPQGDTRMLGIGISSLTIIPADSVRRSLKVIRSDGLEILPVANSNEGRLNPLSALAMSTF